MKIKNGKEIVIGKTMGNTNGSISMGFYEIPFFVKDIKKLCFEPCVAPQFKYSVVIISALPDEYLDVFITKKQYEYLQEKLGANDEEN